MIANVIMISHVIYIFMISHVIYHTSYVICYVICYKAFLYIVVI